MTRDDYVRCPTCGDVVFGEDECKVTLVRCDCCHREVEETEQTEDICHDCYPDCSANYCFQIDETRGGW